MFPGSSPLPDPRPVYSACGDPSARRCCAVDPLVPPILHFRDDSRLETRLSSTCSPPSPVVVDSGRRGSRFAFPMCFVCRGPTNGPGTGSRMIRTPFLHGPGITPRTPSAVPTTPSFGDRLLDGDDPGPRSGPEWGVHGTSGLHRNGERGTSRVSVGSQVLETGSVTGKGLSKDDAGESWEGGSPGNRHRTLVGERLHPTSDTYCGWWHTTTDIPRLRRDRFRQKCHKYQYDPVSLPTKNIGLIKTVNV